MLFLDTEKCRRRQKEEMRSIKNLTSARTSPNRKIKTDSLVRSVNSFGLTLTLIVTFQFTDYLEDIYSVMAQDNFPYETAGNVPLPAYPVDAFCSYMNQSYDSDDDLIDVRN